MKETAILLILTLIFLADTAYSIPAIPNTFFGTVTKDNINITSGTQITVYVEEQYTTYNMTQDGYYDMSIKIGEINDNINFYIDGLLFGTAIRSNGERVNYNLSYATPVQDPIDPPASRPSSGDRNTFSPPSSIEAPTYHYDFSISADSFVSAASGNSTSIEVIITNTGNGTFEEIKISVSGEIPSSWITIVPETISDIKPDDKITATISFNTPLAGIYQLTVKASGMDIEKDTESLLMVKDSDVTTDNIEILSIDSEMPLEPSTTTKVIVTLKNTGQDIEYALLGLANIDDWIVVPESEYVVLNPGMEKTINFEVTVPEDAKADIKEIIASVIGLSNKKETAVEVLDSTEENIMPMAPTGFSITNVSGTIGVVLLISILSLFYIYSRKKQATESITKKAASS